MTTPAPNFRPKSLSPEALEAWDAAEANIEASMQRVKKLTEDLPPAPPTGQIIFNAPLTEEVIRLDKEGFHYKGQFIADAGEAHRLMLAFLKQHAKDEQEPPTDEELRKLWLDLYATNDGPTSGEVVEIARAVLERWGHG
jgi:hypothetical protein